MTSTHPTRLADFWLPILEQARRSFAAPPADTAEVGRSLVAALDAAAARAAEHGHSQDQIQQALFAVVAWIDEAAMTRPWPGASAWRLAPLQRHYFSTTRAGVEFFQRLQALPDDATSVREVYGLMLVAGFAGHYTIKPPGELAAVRREVLERIERDAGMAPLAVDQPLFPSAGASGPVARKPRRARPGLATLLLVAVPICLLVGLYIYLDATLARQVADLLQRV